MEAAEAHSQWDGQNRERKLSEVANGKSESLSYLSSAFKLKVARCLLLFCANSRFACSYKFCISPKNLFWVQDCRVQALRQIGGLALSLELTPHLSINILLYLLRNQHPL
jgi:hypothetical protein